MSPVKESKKPEIKKQIVLFLPYLLDKLVPIYLFIPFVHKINPLKSPTQPLLPGNDVWHITKRNLSNEALTSYLPCEYRQGACDLIRLSE